MSKKSDAAKANEAHSPKKGHAQEPGQVERSNKAGGHQKKNREMEPMRTN
jgi:hypothetical protein